MSNDLKQRRGQDLDGQRQTDAGSAWDVGGPGPVPFRLAIGFLKGQVSAATEPVVVGLHQALINPRLVHRILAAHRAGAKLAAAVDVRGKAIGAIVADPAFDWGHDEAKKAPAGGNELLEPDWNAPAAKPASKPHGGADGLMEPDWNKASSPRPAGGNDTLLEPEWAKAESPKAAGGTGGVIDPDWNKSAEPKKPGLGDELIDPYADEREAKPAAGLPRAEDFALLVPLLASSPLVAARPDATKLILAASKQLFDGSGALKPSVLADSRVQHAFVPLRAPGVSWQDKPAETVAAFEAALAPILGKLIEQTHHHHREKHVEQSKDASKSPARTENAPKPPIGGLERHAQSLIQAVEEGVLEAGKAVWEFLSSIGGQGEPAHAQDPQVAHHRDRLTKRIEGAMKGGRDPEPVRQHHQHHDAGDHGHPSSPPSPAEVAPAAPAAAKATPTPVVATPVAAIPAVTPAVRPAPVVTPTPPAPAAGGAPSGPATSKTYELGGIPPVLTFLPPGGVKGVVDVFMFFHGMYAHFDVHKKGIDNPAEASNMAEAVARSGRNLVALAPSPGLNANNFPKWVSLNKDHGYKQIVDKVLAQISADYRLQPPLSPGQVSLAGHSAGGSALGEAAAQLGDLVRDVTLQDAGYGSVSFQGSHPKLVEWFLSGKGDKTIRVITHGDPEQVKEGRVLKEYLNPGHLKKAAEHLKLSGVEATIEPGDQAARTVKGLSLHHRIHVNGLPGQRLISVFSFRHEDHYEVRNKTMGNLIGEGPTTDFAQGSAPQASLAPVAAPSASPAKERAAPKEAGQQGHPHARHEARSAPPVAPAPVENSASSKDGRSQPATVPSTVEGGADRVVAALARPEHAAAKVASKVAEAAKPEGAAGPSGGKGNPSWEKFLDAEAKKESGGRWGGVIDAGSANTSGQTASYGRYQTTAGAAVGTLKANDDARQRFGFNKADVDHLEEVVNYTDRWFRAVVYGEPFRLKKEFGGGTVDGKSASSDSDGFVEQYGDAFKKSTGLGVELLERMIRTVRLKEFIDKNKAKVRVPKAELDKLGPKERAAKLKEMATRRSELALELFEQNPWLKDLGFAAKDLTGYLRTDMIAENMAGFEMAAAIKTNPKIFDAVNENSGEDFGRFELGQIRADVIKRGTKFGIDMSKLSEEQLYMLIARAHNAGKGRLKKQHFEKPETLLGDDYVAKVMALYHGGDGGKGKKHKGEGTAGVETTKAAPAVVASPTVPASSATSSASPRLPDLEQHAKKADDERKSSTVASNVNNDGGAVVHLEEAGDAYHEGSEEHALGEGDEVFDKEGEILPAFPATADGVVAAAFYELHRGDKRSLAEILADDTAARTARGADAAQEGKVKHEKTDPKTGKTKTHYKGSNTDAKGSKIIGHAKKEGAVGPVEAYLIAGERSAGGPWCGSFASYVYLRAGIRLSTMAYSHAVPDVLAKTGSTAKGPSYYRVTGTEGSAKTSDGAKGYDGTFQSGEFSKKRAKYKDASVKSAKDLDIRPGDVFWQEHDASTGHVGIIVGVYKTEHTVTCVTIEGNASDQVHSKIHKIDVDGSGKVTSGFKGWGRPAQLNSAAPAGAANGNDEEPAWIAAAEKGAKHGKRIAENDR